MRLLASKTICPDWGWFFQSVAVDAAILSGTAPTPTMTGGSVICHRKDLAERDTFRVFRRSDVLGEIQKNPVTSHHSHPSIQRICFLFETNPLT
ncbi:hypothetical protein RBSWK_01546 [Rhodopirellula baltica SWK14]|uniref:Uncharacterized protein n=1 Tax=Rhodopirellula baltica SWK14 TaxID=993516 RepID=L7CNB9_RHOBT|nr:hypothetical protein RBSWK_01546 [Rhodopirellula baltica SWK14]